MFARAKLTANAGAVLRAAAAAPVRVGGKKGGSTSLNGDARNDLIKKVLFDAPARPPVRLSPEDLARHETIERAWKLVRQQRRLAQEEALAKKFEKMRQACAELEKTSNYLFKHSQSKERNAVFPRQLRTITDTPPKKIWDYRNAVPAGSVKA
ncbi:39S ribosomal protein L40, mitochondrial [Actinomortierella ambigua]|nr:39S ribosomal protein L40, mitochondrial [Actinomortierella ambigua]